MTNNGEDGNCNHSYEQHEAHELYIVLQHEIPYFLYCVLWNGYCLLILICCFSIISVLSWLWGSLLFCLNHPHMCCSTTETSILSRLFPYFAIFGRKEKSSLLILGRVGGEGRGHRFFSMNWLGVFVLPLDEILVHRRLPPRQYNVRLP